ncbi:MAG: hypothetical protein FJ276_26990 [Planctomycetes bacterium]|nr:hypothetical protein [Planctomycetota bacterium]
MSHATPSEHCAGRRRFLAGVSAMAAAAWAGNAVRAGEAASEPMPTIQLGPHSVSRIIAGSNPILGYSYLGPHTDRHMKEYFTVEQTIAFLQQCEREGITGHQFSTPDARGESLRLARERGVSMHFICLHSERQKIKADVERAQPIAMVHHGGVTDRFLAEGKFDQVHDFVKAAHDAGVLAGVSAHNPDCIKRVADEGWEVDFFMTCFYFLTRKKPRTADDPSVPTLELSYPFYKDDPLAMTQVIRQVPQPCLAFKILAAGRCCDSQDSVRAAFQFAFARIKPTDGVIVGMYPRFFDEVHANAQYTREFGGVS